MSNIKPHFEGIELHLPSSIVRISVYCFTVYSTRGSVSVPTSTKCLTAGPTMISQLLET